jgi:hypothetical protein
MLASLYAKTFAGTGLECCTWAGASPPLPMPVPPQGLLSHQEGGYVMHKLVIVAAATVSLVTIGLTIQDVSAQTWRGAKTISSASQNFTWIEPIACTRDERCPKGRHWRSGKCVLC